MNKDVEKRKRLHTVLLILVIAALLGILVFITGFPCPLYTLTGLKCPACGSTRAIRALLHGDWAEAYQQNRMLAPELLGAGGLLLYAGLKRTKKGLRLTAVCVAFGFLLVSWMIIRNIYHY